jgi:hypothetical protein
MSLDPTGTGRKRWITRWKAALNAFEITFEGRLSAARNQTPQNRVTPLVNWTDPGRTPGCTPWLCRLLTAIQKRWWAALVLVIGGLWSWRLVASGVVVGGHPAWWWAVNRS